MPATKNAAPVRFLVARRDAAGNFQRVSDSGKVYSSGACHPLADGMSEAAHKAICGAAFWMANETIRPATVDVSVDGEWRISPISSRKDA